MRQRNLRCPDSQTERAMSQLEGNIREQVNQIISRLLRDQNDEVYIHNLPSEDPGNQGQVWNDGGNLKISEG